MLDELCDGLSFAHKMAIVHRDVKPANIMVEEEGGVKVLDFGIARIAESGMTMAGMLIGTLNYMSPEQITGRSSTTAATSLRSALVMYELLSLRAGVPRGASQRHHQPHPERAPAAIGEPVSGAP